MWFIGFGFIVVLLVFYLKYLCVMVLKRKLEGKFEDDKVLVKKLVLFWKIGFLFLMYDLDL